MKEVAELDQELTIEERNLLSVAYKNIIVGVLFLFYLSLSPFPFFPSLPLPCPLARLVPLFGQCKSTLPST